MVPVGTGEGSTGVALVFGFWESPSGFCHNGESSPRKRNGRTGVVVGFPSGIVAQGVDYWDTRSSTLPLAPHHLPPKMSRGRCRAKGGRRGEENSGSRRSLGAADALGG
ncbi:hypothetical protein chiPu_0027713 [Chiloscyllium punctatum]|uniref:Uncharacterized protein n=1 Tax=Chiloscyllium punctatum TaxID=137246 RepID=A0A401TME8_CHIPU|nr:hypothetical protein [Chiloscyllium punctatum]